jgi:CubicO group peptidase (beta-lactamase class C family)
MADAGGQVDKGFEAVRAAFLAAHPGEVGGAQLCVYRHGRPVVDLWTGRDAVNARPYGPDTLTVLMSCTKGAVAILVQQMLERGELSLEAPIAEVWPEFAANGKGEITLAHVLTHSSGLFGWDPDAGCTDATALDWDAATSALAQMAPFWAPGTACLYHFISYGFLLGEAARRATGRTLGQLLAERVSGPLGLDLWIGLPAAEQARVAPHVRATPAFTADALNGAFAAMSLDTTNRVIRGLIGTMVVTDQLIDLMTQAPARAAEVPAGNGVGNAHALARMYAATIGEVEGVRLLRPESVAALRAPRTDRLKAPSPLPPAPDGEAQRFGLGVELPRRHISLLGWGSFGHPGAGGRLAFADPESGCAVGYACNGMLWDGRTRDPRWAWLPALVEAVGA